jgi:tetratricopeptide (TPR) repeat protein
VAVNLYDSLIGLSHFDDAVRVYHDRVAGESWDIIKPQTRIELLEQLFPDGLNKRSRVSNDELLAYVLMELADAYSKNGEPSRAILSLKRAIRNRAARYYGPADVALASALLQTGAICQAYQQSHHLFQVMTRDDRDRNAYRHNRGRRAQHALVRAVMGEIDDALHIWKQEVSEISQQLKFRERYQLDPEGQIVRREAVAFFNFIHAKSFIDPEDVDSDLNWDVVEDSVSTEPELIRVTRFRGIACLGTKNTVGAIDYLYDAIKRSRAINLVEEELPAMVALARLHVRLAEHASTGGERRKQHMAGRELLEQVWSAADRGPYVLWHADARNLLAHLERLFGERDSAIEAATTAYNLAWCNGAPYVYESALSKARRHLQELGVPEPRLPKFDSSKFPPLRELRIGADEDEYLPSKSKQTD